MSKPRMLAMLSEELDQLRKDVDVILHTTLSKLNDQGKLDGEEQMALYGLRILMNRFNGTARDMVVNSCHEYAQRDAIRNYEPGSLAKTQVRNDIDDWNRVRQSHEIEGAHTIHVYRDPVRYMGMCARCTCGWQKDYDLNLFIDPSYHPNDRDARTQRVANATAKADHDRAIAESSG